MSSITRRMTDSVPLGGAFRADFYSTGAVQIFTADLQLATLSGVGELMAEGLVEVLLEGCMELYLAEATAPPRRHSHGDGLLVLDYSEHRNGALTRALLGSRVLTAAEKFAAVVSAQKCNIYAESDASELLAIAERGWRLSELPAKSVPWGVPYYGWLLPEFGGTWQGSPVLASPRLPRFPSPEAYVAALQLRGFMALESDEPFHKLAAAELLPAPTPKVFLPEELGMSLLSCGPALSEKYVEAMTPAQACRFYTHFVTNPTLPILPFQVERFFGGVAPIKETHPATVQDFELVSTMPEAASILTHAEVVELEEAFLLSPLRHLSQRIGTASSGRAAVLALISQVGLPTTEALVEAIAGGAAPMNYNYFLEKIKRAQDLREFLALRAHDYSVVPVAWAVALSPFSS